MNLTRHRGRRILHAATVLLLSSFGGDTSAAPTRIQADVSGTWDAQFTGTVQGTGTSQTDDLVIEIGQKGFDVVGTLRVKGLDLAFPFSGQVSGTTFRYFVRGSLSPTCEVTVEAETTVDAAAGRLSGAQNQSTCEGTAVGEVTAVRR